MNHENHVRLNNRHQNTLIYHHKVKQCMLVHYPFPADSFKKYEIKSNPNMCILMYFKITQNAFKKSYKDFFKAFHVILGLSLWILKYIKMHIFESVFILVHYCEYYLRVLSP